jgi:hypothetical protein
VHNWTGNSEWHVKLVALVILATRGPRWVQPFPAAAEKPATVNGARSFAIPFHPFTDHAV